MTWFKIKRDKADAEFSLYIRRRDKWRCKRCGRQHEEGSKTLGCSHYWGRNHENTRFDPENCDSLCNMPCHEEWEKEKQNKKEYKGEYTRYMIKKLGENGFKILMMNAHTRKRKDRKLSLIIVKELLKSIN